MKTLLLLFLFLFSSTVHAGSVQSVRIDDNGLPLFQKRSGDTSIPIEEGTYTPTFSGFSGQTANVDNPTEFTYQRIGNYVHVIGRAEIDQTAAGSGVFDVSLPLSSNFSDFGDCQGVNGISDAGAFPSGFFEADTANNTCQGLIDLATANDNRRLYIKFSYRLK